MVLITRKSRVQVIIIVKKRKLKQSGMVHMHEVPAEFVSSLAEPCIAALAKAAQENPFGQKPRLSTAVAPFTLALPNPDLSSFVLT